MVPLEAPYNATQLQFTINTMYGYKAGLQYFDLTGEGNAHSGQAVQLDFNMIGSKNWKVMSVQPIISNYYVCSTSLRTVVQYLLYIWCDRSTKKKIFFAIDSTGSEITVVIYDVFN